MATYIGTKNILGGDYAVYADARSERFYIREPNDNADEPDEELGSGETMKAAIAAARTALNKRKVKVAVEFRLDNGQRGTATGLHGRNRRVMVTYQSGAKDQLDHFAKPLKGATPDDVIERLAEIRRQVRELKDEEREIDREWRLDNFGTHVKKAIEEKLAAQEATAA